MPSFVDEHASRVTIQPRSAVTSIPFELLLQIFIHLSATDIIHFLSTNHAYRSLVKDEYIWRELCSRYHIRDLPSSGFHNHTSFYTIYTELLHTYGPLLGLWANDAVFQGNVMEFRVVSESKEVGWEGIVGEVWKFQLDAHGIAHNVNELEAEIRARIRTPTDPAYYECVRIELLPPGGDLPVSVVEADDSPLPATQDSSNSTQWPSPSTRLTRFTWTLHSHVRYGAPRHVPSATVPILLRAPHNQGCYVYRGTPIADPIETATLHPVLPVKIWLDTERPLPRLKVFHEDTLDHRPYLQNQTDQHPVRLVYFAPAPPNERSDAYSISILPTPGQANVNPHRVMHVPPFRGNIMDTRRLLLAYEASEAGMDKLVMPLEARYYPLRSSGTFSSSQQLSRDTASGHWDPRSLEGLWLGAYSAHGTEVLWIMYDTASREVQAWKVTGDANVPRGALSWRFKYGPPPPASSPSSSSTPGDVPAVTVTDELLAEMDVVDMETKARVRMFHGEGTVSEVGFT